jgi:hypothetical protein
MTKRSTLKKLEDLDDYRVSDEDPDPRGWEVTAADGQEIGRVVDLVVDTAAMRARYLDVVVAPGGSVDNDERHMFVPTDSVFIGDAERQQKRVALPVSRDAVRRVAAPLKRTSMRDAERRRGDWPTGPGWDLRLIRRDDNG